MTDHAHSGAHVVGHAAIDHGTGGPHHPVRFYVKIWAILVVLLAISIAGPTLGVFWITMVTAFGVAIVKAYLVAANFMHLNIEKRLGSIIIFAALILMSLFFAGVAPDVMKHEGDQWVNAAAHAETVRRFEKEGEHGEKIQHHEAAPHEGATHAPTH